MTLTSIKFFVFVAATVLVYYICPKRFRWIVLLTASYTFYGIVCLKYMPFIVFTTLSTYACGLWIGKIALKGSAAIKEKKGEWTSEEKKSFKAKLAKKKRLVLTLALVLNFGILAVLKYYNFFSGSVTGLLHNFGTDAELPVFKLFLPLGISFYTFQAMGYLIDVCRGKTKAEKNPAKFALFVSFFPQIIQGPISIYSDLAKQLYEPHALKYENIKYGFQLILWGLFKKMVIADRAVVVINTVLGNRADYSGTFVLLTALMYALQLYADFSGGIDISRGVAQMLGINLAENFKRPYFSKSIGEYWRRWHITLGAWMKNYIFYSLTLSGGFLKLGKWTKKHLGKHIGKVLPGSIATFVVFLVIGLWHGANWKYIGFGVWNGAIMFVSSLLEPAFRKFTSALKIRTECLSYRIFQMIRTFVIVLIGYYFDIADSFKDALAMMKNSVLDFHAGELMNLAKIQSLGLEYVDYGVLAVAAAVLLAVSLFQERHTTSGLRVAIGRQNIIFQWIVMLCGIAAIVAFGMYGPGTSASEFVYMQF